MKRPIAIGLAPNIQKQDGILAFELLFDFTKYKKGVAIVQLEKWFEKYFHVSTSVGFTSGRGALYAILTSLDIGKGDEVILQAFTCVAVAQASFSTGATPVYADITKEYTVDHMDVEKKITSHTKAIIVQHTFGLPADIEALQKITKEKNIACKEDCAHTIGGMYHGKKLGTFGSASIFSFGRDKAFSCKSGGNSINSNKDLGENLKKFHRQKSMPSFFWIFQNLFHPVVFYFLILPLYDTFRIGQIVLIFLQKIHVLSVPVDKNTKTLRQDEIKKMPNALSSLALLQLSRLERTNKKRVSTSSLYQKELPMYSHPNFHTSTPLLRYPLPVASKNKLISTLRKKHMYIGN